MMNEEMQAAAPQVRSTPYQAPMHNFNGSILFLTNPENELHRFELTLRNCMVDDKGTIHRLGEPLMNEDGIKSVVGQTQSIVNQDTVMSHFQEEIPQLINLFADSLIKDLMMNRANYNIVIPAARDKITSMATTYAYTCLRRAFEQGEKKFWKGSQQEITTRVEGVPSQSKGLSGLMGWGKR
jgi:hypothetical protein